MQDRARAGISSRRVLDVVDGRPVETQPGPGFGNWRCDTGADERGGLRPGTSRQRPWKVTRPRRLRAPPRVRVRRRDRRCDQRVPVLVDDHRVCRSVEAGEGRSPRGTSSSCSPRAGSSSSKQEAGVATVEHAREPGPSRLPVAHVEHAAIPGQMAQPHRYVGGELVQRAATMCRTVAGASVPSRPRRRTRSPGRRTALREEVVDRPRRDPRAPGPGSDQRVPSQSGQGPSETRKAEALRGLGPPRATRSRMARRKPWKACGALAFFPVFEVPVRDELLPRSVEHEPARGGQRACARAMSGENPCSVLAAPRSSRAGC